MAEEEVSGRAKVLHRVKSKDSDGEHFVLVIMSDPDQFIVADERIAQSGKTEGQQVYVNKRYYPTLKGALFQARHRLAKAEAKDLSSYMESVQNYDGEFLMALDERMGRKK